MKTIEKDELYRTISEFMKSKGLELTDGPYAGHIRRGCDLLSDAINATQRTVVRAREEMDKKLLKLRQCIHEATAPNPRRHRLHRRRRRQPRQNRPPPARLRPGPPRRRRQPGAKPPRPAAAPAVARLLPRLATLDPDP